MHYYFSRFGLVIALLVSSIDPCWALDSYRFLHVTIETPWLIFIFLLFAILAPFILMALLVWRYAERRISPEKTSDTQPEDIE
jgi:hypothetical protein